MEVLDELRQHVSSEGIKAARARVLAAIDETVADGLAEDGGRAPTPGDYVGALVTALESASAHHEELLYLLSVLLPSIGKGSLAARFAAVVGILARCNKLPSAESSQGIQRPLLSSFVTMLAALDSGAGTWARPEVRRVLSAVVQATVHKQPKVRKVAQTGALSLLRSHGAVVCRPLLKFCQSVLSSAAVSRDPSRGGQMLSYCCTLLPALPLDAAEPLVETLLRVPVLGNRGLSLWAMKALHALLLSRESDLPPPALAALLNSLKDLQPSAGDSKVAAEYVAALSHGLVRLADVGDEALLTDLLAPHVAGLVDYLEADRRTVQLATREALSRVVFRCITDGMVEEALEAEGRAGVLANVLHSLSRLLQPRFRLVWFAALPVLEAVFHRLGLAGDPLLRPLLTALGEAHDGADGEPALQRNIRAVLAAALQEVGVQCLLECVPLEDDSGAPAEERLWLIDIMKASLRTSPALRLSFFNSYILRMANACLAAARELPPAEAQLARMRAALLWSLFPAFAAGAVAVGEDFPRMARVLGVTLEQTPVLRGCIADGLDKLITRQFEVLQLAAAASGGAAGEAAAAAAAAVGGREADAGGPAAAAVSEEEAAEAQAALDAVAALSDKFLLSLFKAYDAVYASAGSSRDEPEAASALLRAVTAVTRVSKPALVARMFAQVMKRMLAAMEAEDGAARVVQLDALAQALLPQLGEKDRVRLFRAIRGQLLADAEGAEASTVQKRAYRVLTALCTHAAPQLLVAPLLEEMSELLLTSLAASSSNGKKFRLRCLSALLLSLDMSNDDHLAFIPSVLGEIVVCTKEKNSTTRSAALELLSTIARRYRDDLPDLGVAAFFQQLLAGLAFEEPHQRSSAVRALTWVLSFFASEPGVAELATELVDSLLLLLKRERSREVAETVLVYFKVAARSLPPQLLATKLEAVVGGMLTLAQTRKMRLKKPIRVVLERLSRKFSMEDIAAAAPAQDRPLMEHLRKQLEKTKAEKKLKRAKYKASRAAELLLEDEEMDAAGDMAASDAHGRGSASAWLDEKDGVIDLLDAGAVKSISTRDPRRARRAARGDGEEELKLDADGRLVIPDDGEEDADDMRAAARQRKRGRDDDGTGEGGDDDGDEGEDAWKKHRRRPRRGEEFDGGDEDDDSDDEAARHKRAGKRRKVRSKDDVTRGKKSNKKSKQKKPQKYEPYTYVPMQRRMLNPRRRRAAVDRFQKVVRR